MTSAQLHRRAANLIKKRYQSKFLDTSNLALERRKPPKEWATRQPPSFSDLFGTAEPDVIFPGIGTKTQATTNPTTTSTSSTLTPTLSSVTSTSITTVTTTTSSSTSTTLTTTSSSSKPVKTGMYTPPVTTSTSVTHTTAEAAVTSSAAAVAQTGGSSSGAIAGGIIAAILAVAGIIFAILFIRRQRKRQAEENAFDAKEFRRSAMLMPDPPTHEDTIARGFNPRPPSMIERHMASPASMFGAQYATQAPVAGTNAYGEEYPSYNPDVQFASFTPGQVVNYNAPPPKPLPNPFATPTKTQFGPIASPFAGPGQYEQQVYGDQGSLTRQLSSGSTTTYPVLTRQSSLTNPHPHQENAAPVAAVTARESTVPDNDYVDLSRSSVSPFQAAQYAEISRRLKTEVPSGLTTPEAAQSQFALATAAVDRDLPPLPPPKEDDEHQSPFADPISTPSTPTPRVSNTFYNQQLQPEQQQGEMRPISAAESDLSQEVVFPVDLDFPVPPSPVHTISSRYRVDSTPPMLPEILVESRVSVSGYEFAPPPRHGDSSNLAPSPLGSGFPSPAFATTRFPATPSPLASSFGIITPRQEGGFDQEHGEIVPPPLVKQEKQKINGNGSGLKRSNTVYSMYDGEDAYGGI